MEKSKIILAILAAAFLVMAGCIGPVQSIVPTSSNRQYYTGQTVTWIVALNQQDGIALANQLGCYNSGYHPINISYGTWLRCVTPSYPNGANFPSTSNLGLTTSMSCDFFKGSSGAVTMAGQASARIPNDATSCTIQAQFSSVYGSKTAVQDDTTNTGYIGVSQTVPQCTGSYTCNGQTLKTCVNGQQGSDVRLCPFGCTGGACNSGCSPNAVTECNGLSQYYQCSSDGTSKNLKNVASGQQCVNGALVSSTPPPTPEYITCPDNTQVLKGTPCPAYCGDGICNGNEQNTNSGAANYCLRDCPVTPTPQNNQTCYDGSAIGQCSIGGFGGRCAAQAGTAPIFVIDNVCPAQKCFDGTIIGQCNLAGQICFVPIPANPSLTMLEPDASCTVSLPAQSPKTDDWILYALGAIFGVVIILIAYFAMKK